MQRVLCLTILLAACAAVDARAQSEAAIGLGLAVSSMDPIGQQAIPVTHIGPLLRVKLGTGFGPAIGFNWFGMGVTTVAGGERVYLGHVRVRPVMVGVAYNWNRGKAWLSPSVVAGYAFTRIDINDRVRPALRSALGSSFLSFDTTNGFAWRPQLAFWYDVAPRVGLMASLAYVGVRPGLRTTTDLGVRSSTLDLASTSVTFGLVYGIF